MYEVGTYIIMPIARCVVTYTINLIIYEYIVKLMFILEGYNIITKYIKCVRIVLNVVAIYFSLLIFD